MAHSLESLTAAIRAALHADGGPAGREQVAGVLREVLADREFVSRYLDDQTPQREVWYLDDAQGFAILGHHFREARRTAPHDHGTSWAIYGQAEGETVMDEWAVVTPAAPGVTGKVRLVRSLLLQPGDVRIYHEGEIHSPRREGAAKLIRIEGRHVQEDSGRRWEPWEQ